MNLLFEIPDALLIVVAIIVFIIFAIVAVMYKAFNRKVKPIDEEDRYDSDEIKITKIAEIPEENDLTDEQIEAKEELQRVFSRMSEDLEKQKAEEVVDNFEREQEENAIISYQELMKQAEKLKEEARFYEKQAEEVSDMQVMEVMNHISKEAKKTEEKPKTQGFKSSDIISPIYGIQSNKDMIRQKSSSKKPKRDIIGNAYEEKRFLEETQNLEFLNNLKQFRKNL